MAATPFGLELARAARLRALEPYIKRMRLHLATKNCNRDFIATIINITVLSMAYQKYHSDTPLADSSSLQDASDSGKARQYARLSCSVRYGVWAQMMIHQMTLAAAISLSGNDFLAVLTWSPQQSC